MKKVVLLLLLLLCAQVSLAAKQKSYHSGKMTVYGKKRSSKKITGTRYEISMEDKEAFGMVDPHRVISEAPGAYVQDEDGFGLRPNIGIRGTHPHRSKKITLLEDGVFLSPAPYSAPAAYYFPQMTKIVGADLIKGSMSSLYGPTSVGGAFNFKTREITQNSLEGHVNLTAGGFERFRTGLSNGDSTDDRISQSSLLSAHVSQNFGRFSYLIEGGLVDADGFNELQDINDETGFEKWDGLLKLKYQISKNQKVEMKASRAAETSFASYTGLTEQDFSINPYQRYAASQLDQMDWSQEQINLTYENKFSTRSKLSLTAYSQEFVRDWNKLDRFAGSNVPALGEILSNPDLPANQEYYRILTGEFDTENTGVDTLVITNNGRSYFSRGVQGVFHYEFKPSLYSKVKNFSGVRWHRDGVSRNHVSNFYDMFEGQLEREFSETLEAETVKLNREQSSVLSAFHQSSYQSGTWTIDANFRLERLFQKGFDELDDRNYRKDQTLFAPGIGVSKMVGTNLVFFGGVHRGLGAAGPAPSEGARPEESVNYELGYRYVNRGSKFEMALFATDYQNIKGFCSASSGCVASQIDDEFSGGAADVYGLEASLKTSARLSSRIVVPITIGYTLTNAEFNNSFESTALNEWGVGVVRKGDPLPYIPEHQLSVSTGFSFGKAFLQARWNRRSRVFDQAVSEGRKVVQGFDVTDVAATWKLRKKMNISAAVDNVFGREYITSFRPFGARPGKPQHYKVSLNYKF